jgi:hypothetical protein
MGLLADAEERRPLDVSANTTRTSTHALWAALPIPAVVGMVAPRVVWRGDAPRHSEA